MQTRSDNKISTMKYHSYPTRANVETIDLGLQSIEILGKKHGNTQLQLDKDCIRYNNISLGAGGSLPLLIQVINSQIIKVLKTVMCKQTEIKILFLK